MDHYRTRHARSANPFHCVIEGCQMRFSTTNRLEEHVRVEHINPPKPGMVSIMSLSWKQVKVIRRQLVSAHLFSEGNSCSCPEGKLLWMASTTILSRSWVNYSNLCHISLSCISFLSTFQIPLFKDLALRCTVPTSTKSYWNVFVSWTNTVSKSPSILSISMLGWKALKEGRVYTGTHTKLYHRKAYLRSWKGKLMWGFFLIAIVLGSEKPMKVGAMVTFLILFWIHWTKKWRNILENEGILTTPLMLHSAFDCCVVTLL